MQDMSLSECIDALLRAAQMLGFLQHQLTCAQASVDREIGLGLSAVELFRAEFKQKNAEVDKAKHRKHLLLCTEKILTACGSFRSLLFVIM